MSFYFQTKYHSIQLKHFYEFFPYYIIYNYKMAQCFNFVLCGGAKDCDDEAKLKNKKKKKNERRKSVMDTHRKKSLLSVSLVLCRILIPMLFIFILLLWTYLQKHYISLNLVSLKCSIALDLWPLGKYYLLTVIFTMFDSRFNSNNHIKKINVI